MEDRHRQAADAGRPQETAQAASRLTVVPQQAADLQQLLPAVIEARNRLVTVAQQLQGRVDAFQTRKEVLKATYATAQGALRVHEAIAASGLAGGDADEQQEDTGETINPAQAALADVTAQMEREPGREGWPEGLMELRPGAPVHRRPKQPRTAMTTRGPSWRSSTQATSAMPASCRPRRATNRKRANVLQRVSNKIVRPRDNLESSASSTWN